jgi:hypothetical protein
MRWCIRAGLAGVVAVLCGSAAGQDAVPEKDPMAGPEVREQRIRGVEQGFSEARRERWRAGGVVPHRVFMQAINGLRGRGEHAAPESLQLTADQEALIKRLDSEFRSTMSEQGGKAERRAGRRPEPQPGDQPSGEEPRQRRPVSRDRMNEADGANAADLHARVFAELSEPQREYVNGRIAEWRQEADRRMGEQAMQRRIKQRGNAAPTPPAGPQRERLRRIVERLAQLPPEERERILSRLEDDLARAGREGVDRPRRPEGDRRPADRAEKVPPPPPAGGERPPRPRPDR